MAPGQLTPEVYSRIDYSQFLRTSRRVEKERCLPRDRRNGLNDDLTDRYDDLGRRMA